jgi:hypothetical protein
MRQPLKNLLPPDMTVRHTPVFGGFYQKVVATRKSHG